MNLGLRDLVSNSFFTRFYEFGMGVCLFVCNGTFESHLH